MRYLPLFGTVACVLAGCIVVPSPYLKVTAPEVRGRVLDDVTRQPVAGVVVAFEGQAEAHVTSGIDGTFRIPRQQDVVLTRVFTPCPVYEYPTPRRMPGAIVLAKPGWQRRTVGLAPYYGQLRRAERAGTIWHPNAWDNPVVQLGDIALAR